MLPLPCDLGQHFQDFGHSFTVYGLPSGKKPSISTIFQAKGNFDKTRMINRMKIVKHVNSTTQQQQLLYFPRAFSLSLGGNNTSRSAHAH